MADRPKRRVVYVNPADRQRAADLGVTAITHRDIAIHLLWGAELRDDPSLAFYKARYEGEEFHLYGRLPEAFYRSQEERRSPERSRR